MGKNPHSVNHKGRSPRRGPAFLIDSIFRADTGVCPYTWGAYSPRAARRRRRRFHSKAEKERPGLGDAAPAGRLCAICYIIPPPKKTLPDGDVFFRVLGGIRKQMLEIWRYRMNNSSRYFGRGQRLSSTMSSSLSIW